MILACRRANILRMYETPILFIIFNRFETTKQVFDEIRKVKPKFLFIAGDGPRPDKEGDDKNCAEARGIVKLVDWDCEVKTLFQQNNLGCGVGPVTAINWFFEQVEEGIVLEDDCLPAPDFFVFCQAMLKKYRHDEQIFHVSGNNFQLGRKRGDASYYFSKYTGTWGWATWRRAWKAYRFNIENLASFLEQKKLDQVIQSKGERAYWTRIFGLIELGKRQDIWDYQWTFTVWDQGGLTIFPNVNLVKNIGFQENATHTFDPESLLANIALGKIDEIIHPSEIVRNKTADNFFYRKVLAVEFRKHHPKKSLYKQFVAPFTRRLKKLVN